MAALDRDQTGINEFADVVGQERLLDVEQGDELALADLHSAAAQHVDDAYSKRLAERLRHRRDALGVERLVKSHGRSATHVGGGPGRKCRRAHINNGWCERHRSRRGAQAQAAGPPRRSFTWGNSGRTYARAVPHEKVDDIQMYYERSGVGEPLVLVCGLGLDISECARLIGLLAEHYAVLAFDNRGAGRTNMPDAPYTIPRMAQDTVGLMRSLDTPHAHIVGISMGGRIALEVALSHPEMVHSLVLASTSARVIRSWPTRILGAIGRLPLLRSPYPQPRYAFERQRLASRDYCALDRLAEIRSPTLVAHGRRDRLVPVRLAEELCSGIAGAKLVLADGGHIFPLTRAENFVTEIVQFTRTV